MSVMKHIGNLSVIAMSALLYGACQEAGDGEDVAQLHQKSGLWNPTNSSTGIAALANNYVSLGIRKSVVLGVTTWNVMTLDMNTQMLNNATAQVDSILYNGQPVSNLTTTQGWFQVTTSSGNTYTVNGSSFQLDFHFASPISGKLRLSSSDNAATYGRYAAHFLPDTAGAQWQPYCWHWYSDGTNTAQPLAEALIPIAGAKWAANGSRIDDSAAISFGCVNDAIGACVDWGYAPWDSATTWSGFPPKATLVSLKDSHQACTRMKRADFCGNGTGNTSDFNTSTSATVIQVWDSFNVHSMTPQTRDTMEAYWNTDGATCVNPDRLRAHTQYFTDKMNYQLNTVCPGKPLCRGTTVNGLAGSARPCAQDPNTLAWTCP